MSRITPWLIGATIIAILAVSVLSLRRRFYPPEANGREIYAEQRGVPSGCVSHETFDELLKKHVKGDLIDYSALKGDSAALKMYLDSLADVVVKNCSRDELLALYINAYNAATLHLILEHYPGIASIKDIPADTRWNAKRWKIAGETLSLSDVEHQRQVRRVRRQLGLGRRDHGFLGRLGIRGRRPRDGRCRALNRASGSAAPSRHRRC